METVECGFDRIWVEKLEAPSNTDPLRWRFTAEDLDKAEAKEIRTREILRAQFEYFNAPPK